MTYYQSILTNEYSGFKQTLMSSSSPVPKSNTTRVVISIAAHENFQPSYLSN